MNTGSNFNSPENVAGYVKSALLGKNRVNLEVIISRVKETYNLNLFEYAYNHKYGKDKSIETVSKYVQSLDGTSVIKVNGAIPTYLVSVNLSANSLKAAHYCRQTKEKKKNSQKMNNSNLNKSIHNQSKLIYSTERGTFFAKKNNDDKIKGTYNGGLKSANKDNKVNQLKVEIGKKISYKKNYIFPTPESSPEIFKRISFSNGNFFPNCYNNTIVNDQNTVSNNDIFENLPSTSTSNRNFQKTFGNNDYYISTKKNDYIFMNSDEKLKLSPYNNLIKDHAIYNDMDYGTLKNEVFNNRYLMKKEKTTTDNSKADLKSFPVNKLSFKKESYNIKETFFYKALEMHGMLNKNNENNICIKKSNDLTVKNKYDYRHCSMDYPINQSKLLLSEFLYLKDYEKKIETDDIRELLISFNGLSIY